MEDLKKLSKAEREELIRQRIAYLKKKKEKGQKKPKKYLNELIKKKNGIVRFMKNDLREIESNLKKEKQKVNAATNQIIRKMNEEMMEIQNNMDDNAEDRAEVV